MTTGATAPYLRIAADLRGRIARGDLAPGDRVPSTREITRTWGVAMATATKALASLNQDGLVRSVPGVGTVVAEPHIAPEPAFAARATPPAFAGRRRPPGHLSLARIAASAVAVADAEGMVALSMRRVAAELGVAPMSLYRHVTDKDDLVLRMLDLVFGELDLPVERPVDWRGGLETAARVLWATFRQHPWLAGAVSVTRPQATPRTVALTEWVLDALDGHGLQLPTMVTVHLTLVNYVRGAAVDIAAETEAEAVTGLDSEQWLQTQEATVRALVSTGHFPTFERMVTAGFDFDLDVLFDFGLQRLLDGLAVLLDGPLEPNGQDTALVCEDSWSSDMAR